MKLLMLKSNLLLVLAIILFATNGIAQSDFQSKGTIEYEYKVNNHKNFWWSEDDENDDENAWRKTMVENTPKFSTYFYTLKFADNKSIFAYKGKPETDKKMWGDDQKEEDMWYINYTTNKYTNQRNIFGEVMKIEDSIQSIKWKLVPNDVREFAGFTCKKAIGKIFDSVYVFAYYTDAITLSGGPMNINGLPGTIMAITVPRLAISCVATSFTPLVNEEAIQPPKKGKAKPSNDILKKIKEATKDWGSYAEKGIWQCFM